RPIDGAVDMRFRRQMHDGLRPVLLENAIERGAVADVDLLESIALASGRIGQGLQVSGIGKLVHVHDGVKGMADDVAHQGRANESGSAGNKNFHEQASENKAKAAAICTTGYRLHRSVSLLSTAMIARPWTGKKVRPMAYGIQPPGCLVRPARHAPGKEAISGRDGWLRKPAAPSADSPGTCLRY